MEINSHWRDYIAQIQDNPQLIYPTFNLALKILPNGHWQGINPQGPLRRWKIIEVGAGTNLTQSPLRLDERILHFLWGIPSLDERLQPMVAPLASVDRLVPSYEDIVEEVAQSWIKAQNKDFPVIQLCGDDSFSKQAIAQQVAFRGRA
jgi:hypothetical protein